MTLKEFHTIAPTLDYSIIQRQGVETICLLAAGNLWEFNRPKLGSRKIKGIYQNYNKDLFVVLEEE